MAVLSQASGRRSSRFRHFRHVSVSTSARGIFDSLHAAQRNNFCYVHASNVIFPLAARRWTTKHALARVVNALYYIRDVDGSIELFKYFYAQRKAGELIANDNDPANNDRRCDACNNNATEITVQEQMKQHETLQRLERIKIRIIYSRILIRVTIRA